MPAHARHIYQVLRCLPWFQIYVIWYYNFLISFLTTILFLLSSLSLLWLSLVNTINFFPVYSISGRMIIVMVIFVTCLDKVVKSSPPPKCPVPSTTIPFTFSPHLTSHYLLFLVLFSRAKSLLFITVFYLLILFLLISQMNEIIWCLLQEWFLSISGCSTKTKQKR